MKNIYPIRLALCDKKRPLKKSFSRFHAIILLSFLLSSFTGWGQQVIGSFPSMDGGYENQSTIATLSTIAAGIQSFAWTVQNSSGTSILNTSGGRSGPHFVTYGATASRRLQSPTAEDQAIANATAYTIQFYYKSNATIAATGQAGVSPSGTASVGTYVSSGVTNTSGVWTKVQVSATSGTYASTPRYGTGIIRWSGASTNNIDIDDFVMYLGTADNTAPNSPGTVTVGNATESSLDVSWVAASGGEDGGGYVTVRFSSDPGTGNDPNPNGIYAAGNSVATGGTVVYIGTGTSFTDNGLTASTPYWYKVYTADKAFNYSDESTGTGSTTAAGTPTLYVNPSTLNGFSYLLGAGPSASQSYSLSGSGLTGAPGDITVTGTTNYEVSGDNNTFGATVSIPYTTEILSATPVYVRLKSGLAVNTYNSESVANTGGGVGAPVNVICNGLVYNSEPSNHATNFQPGTLTSLTISLTWTDATGGTVPTAYLVKGSAASFAAITQPADNTPEADGALVKNVAAGIATVTFTGLLPNTAYYFKIWPYTNSGAYIDYKLDGTVPEQSATTFELYFRSKVVSGAWNMATTWEISSDNSFWANATTEMPVYRNADVTIKSGHTVIVPTGYTLGTTKNLTVETGATLYAGTSTGSCFINVYANLLNDGTIGGATDVIGFDIEGTSCNLSGSGSFIVARMAKFTTATATTNLTINQNVTLTYTNATGNALSNGQSGTTMFNITLAAGKRLTVSPAKINLTGCTLTLNSDNTGTASLIDSGILPIGYTGVTVQRYISAWTDGMHGWHFLSSPVASQTVAPAFTDPAPANYDFYSWGEPTNEWLNQKVGANNITSFVPGSGYLVAYSASGTKQFNGALNAANVTASGLTASGGVYNGWNLIGNPFACALKWNDGIIWTVPSDFAGTAKVWDEPSASYIDRFPNDIIPAMNGFMVQVLSGSPASLTIPVAARAHNATPWFKSAGERIMLIAYDRTNNTAQQSIIRLNDQATEGYDAAYDSRFLAGYAPQFYSLAGEELFSTNTLPNLDNGRVIEMGFVKNAATEFSIGLNTENMIPGLKVYLTDKKTGAVTELSQNHEYSFTASEGDEVNRFRLHFGALGIDDPSTDETFSIYSYDGNIYVTSQQAGTADVKVSNLLGQVVMHGQAIGNSLTTLNAGNLKNGIYVVSVVSGSQAVSCKVSVNR